MTNKSSDAHKNTNSTTGLQRWLENIWYNNGAGKFLLLPLTAIYCALNTAQRWKSRNNNTQLPCPVIVVGNITVGGTGKTPLTIHIVQLLKKAGFKPAIITRGYGGKATNWPQSVSADSDPQQVGDEAVLMAIRTQVPVYAGADRLLSIEKLSQAHDCDVIISDDGMQHYKMPRDIQIAVIDGERMLGNGWCLPAGPLRERKQRLNDCEFLVVNGKIAKEEPFVSQWFDMSLTGKNLVNLITQEQKNIDDFSNTNFHAVTGIGNPPRFFKTLESLGLALKKHSFPDHHDFIVDDLQFADDLPVVMTEKDAVKCKKIAKDNYWYLPITAELESDFDESILKLLS